MFLQMRNEEATQYTKATNSCGSGGVQAIPSVPCELTVDTGDALAAVRTTLIYFRMQIHCMIFVYFLKIVGR